MLDLNEMKVETTTVKFNDEEFVINPDVPPDIVEDMQALEVGKDDIKEMREIMIRILSHSNDPEKSEKFINGLGIVSFGKVSTFISKFIAEVMRKKD